MATKEDPARRDDATKPPDGRRDTRTFLVRATRDPVTGELIARMRVVDGASEVVALGPEVMRVLGAALVGLAREEAANDVSGASVVEREEP